MTKHRAWRVEHFCRPLTIAGEIGLCLRPDRDGSGACVQSLRGPSPSRDQLVCELGQHRRRNERRECRHAPAVYIHDMRALVPIQARLQSIQIPQHGCESFDFLVSEAVGLERHAGPISRSVVHEPHRDRYRCEQVFDALWYDLSAVTVKALPPFREDRVRPSDKLRARVETITEPLIELMQRHRREVVEDLTFPRG